MTWLDPRTWSLNPWAQKVEEPLGPSSTVFDEVEERPANPVLGGKRRRTGKKSRRSKKTRRTHRR